MGGPKKGGWTRTGEAITCPDGIKLLTVRREDIKIDDGLEKNMSEVIKWHVSFLLFSGPVESTAYYNEYLILRNSKEHSILLAQKFKKLHENMRKYGYNQKFPVLVADINSLGLGIKWFRFDGCHRLASAKVLGIDIVPAYVFILEADQ
jgi:hypothetical protein